MESISRRKFLQHSGTGAAAVGAFSALFGLPGVRAFKRSKPAVHSTGLAAPAGRARTGPVVVHVPDPRTGEVHVMVGTREVVQHDPALVARIVHAAG